MSEDFSRGIVKYTSRDYESIIKDFWDVVPTLTELWKPEADADPGVVLGVFLASVADMLGVNVDILSNELFAPSVSQRKNAEKLFSLIGYELGFYTAARTEVTFTNNSAASMELDFGFNGSNFCTVNAYTDITDQSRVITYNILPFTNKYGATESRSRRVVKTENVNVFAEHDYVTLAAGESVTRVAIEGELRSYSVSVADVKKNNYVINIPSQHIDTTAIWIKAKASRNADEFLATQWIQCNSPAEFVTPEPRFAVTYDSYSNAQVTVSNYLNQLENYENNYLTVYWIDCSGIIGCVGTNVLSNYLQAWSTAVSDESGELTISNLSNTVELPHTNTITGKSPETAKEAYFNSRNYINTFDSLVTLPDFNRFLNREPGVDCGLVIDCQKALDINLAIYRDTNIPDAQKSKMYITNYDFPEGNPNMDWTSRLNLKFAETMAVHTMVGTQTLEDVASMYGIPYADLLEYNNLTSDSDVSAGTKIRLPKYVDETTALKFTSNFKTYTAMCFAVHNDFKNSIWGEGQEEAATLDNIQIFTRYKPPQQFIDNVIRDYRPLQAMTVELEFGYVRLFDFYVIGTVYPKKPVTSDVAYNIIAKIKEDLAIFFSPANRHIGQMPTLMEVVRVIEAADSRIDYFDAGNLRNNVIHWNNCSIDWFNAISFARYSDPGLTAGNIIISPDYVVRSK